MSEKTKKITLVSLILMIFTSTFGFANTTVAYDQMGYGSILVCCRSIAVLPAIFIDVC